MIQPKGKNTLTTGLLFENRKIYDIMYFPKDKNNIINFWKTSANYGRINKDLEILSIKESSIKQIAETTNKHFINEVVAIAYKDFITEYKKADFIKVIPKSNLNPLSIKKSLLDPNPLYRQHVSETLDAVINSNQNLFKNNVFTIQEFVNNVCSLLLPITFVLTKTKYLSSNLTFINSSGLSIEFSTNSHDDDTIKAKKFIEDENFNFYVNTAEKYSFFVDKNAPWRLTFNISTDYALGIMNQLGYNTLEDFFNKSYEKVYLNDYNLLKELIIEKYNSLYDSKPKTQNISFSHDQQKLLFSTKFKSNAIELEELIWIKIWYFFRLCEERINLSQNQFIYNLKYISDLYIIDKQKCLKWIESQTNAFLDGGTNPSYNQLAAADRTKRSSARTFLLII
jgi:hypothetical protein